MCSPIGISNGGYAKLLEKVKKLERNVAKLKKEGGFPIYIYIYISIYISKYIYIYKYTYKYILICYKTYAI